MLVRLFALCALACSFVSCVTPPTAAELNAAKIGDCPDEATAQLAVRWLAGPHLHDPNTALFEFPAATARGYFKGALRPKVFAWAMPVYITDRSSFGGFGIKWLYEFYFIDDAMVAYGATDYSTGWRTSHSMEFADPVPLEIFRSGQVPAEYPRSNVEPMDPDQEY